MREPRRVPGTDLTAAAAGDGWDLTGDDGTAVGHVTSRGGLYYTTHPGDPAYATLTSAARALTARRNR